MTVACPECRSVFRVDPGKVPVSGVRARCAVCGGVIAIAGGTLPVSVGGGASPVREWADAGWPPAPPEPVPAPMTPAPAVLTPVTAAPAVPTPAVAAPVVPRHPTPAYSDIPVSFPVFGRTHTPASVPAVPAVPAASPAFAMPSGGVGAAPSAPPPAAPIGGGAAEQTGEAATAARPSINPFLRSDPEARARRLARALVSDLVAYHPQRREEGVREGTLRQLFRDDIRKSYEEYQEQVGRELAERTRYFQDALNDILAGGRALF